MLRDGWTGNRRFYKRSSRTGPKKLILGYVRTVDKELESPGTILVLIRQYVSKSVHRISSPTLSSSKHRFINAVEYSYCRSLTKVKFSTDQVRPALGSGS